MAKVNYEDVTTKVFYNLLVGEFFIFNKKLYLKLNHSNSLNTFDFEEDKTVTFTESARVILKNGKDIEITVK